MTPIAATPQDISKAPQSMRLARVILVASLALNAAFIGGLISAFVRHGPPPPQAGRTNAGAAAGLGAFVATLPVQRSHAILTPLGEKRRAVQALRQDVKEARDAVFSALAVDPFDKERYLAAQAHLIDIENRQRLAMAEIMADIAGTMTPDERRAFLRWRGSPPPSPLRR